MGGGGSGGESNGALWSTHCLQGHMVKDPQVGSSRMEIHQGTGPGCRGGSLISVPGA